MNARNREKSRGTLCQIAITLEREPLGIFESSFFLNEAYRVASPQNSSSRLYMIDRTLSHGEFRDVCVKHENLEMLQFEQDFFFKL